MIFKKGEKNYDSIVRWRPTPAGSSGRWSSSAA